MGKQLTINRDTRTSDWQIFAKRKSAVNGQMSMVKCSSRGFTLVEMIIYIAFFAVLSVLAINATILVMKSFYSLRMTQSISQSATTALERMSREIRSATGIVTADSNFSPTTPARLTLSKKDGSGSPTTVEFYQSAGSQLNMKEGSVDKGSLMTKTVTITNLAFWSITTPSGSKAIKIEMTLRDSRADMVKTVKFYDTIVLRGTIR